ncbi:MAG: hypothetical protein E6I84_07755 [Chloroflexi bacterium]|nr:MAG: hypothetical protein E6I84_07755 [Chloroflexota bacterium]
MKRGPSIATRAYIAAMSVGAVVAAGILWGNHPKAASLAMFVVVAAVGAIAHAYPIQGFRHQAYQVTLPFIVIAAAVFSTPQLVAFILLIHVAEQARLRRRVHIQWFNACDYFISAAIAAVLFHRATILLPHGALGQLIGAVAAACSFILVNRLLLAGVLWLARGLSLAASGLFQPELLAADLVIAWIAGPMLVMALGAGPWTMLFTAGPLLLARPALSSLIGRRQPALRSPLSRAA